MIPHLSNGLIWTKKNNFMLIYTTKVFNKTKSSDYEMIFKTFIESTVYPLLQI